MEEVSSPVLFLYMEHLLQDRTLEPKKLFIKYYKLQNPLSPLIARQMQSKYEQR